MPDNRGRPRSFDSETVLDQALGLFWRQGYLGTSYTDLCAKTGLTKPSLYSAYGNKEQTFVAALDLYISRYVQPGIDGLEREPDAREAIRRLLVRTTEGLTAEGTPPGCMIATNAACVEAPDIPVVVADAIRAATRKTPNAITTRLTRGQADGQLPPATSVSAMAAFYDTLITGFSNLAKQGAQENALLEAIDIAMLIWPSATLD